MRAFIYERDLSQVIATALLADAAWPSELDINAMSAEQRVLIEHEAAEEAAIDEYYRDLNEQLEMEELEFLAQERDAARTLVDPW